MSIDLCPRCMQRLHKGFTLCTTCSAELQQGPTTIEDKVAREAKARGLSTSEARLSARYFMENFTPSNTRNKQLDKSPLPVGDARRVTGTIPPNRSGRKDRRQAKS